MELTAKEQFLDFLNQQGVDYAEDVLDNSIEVYSDHGEGCLVFRFRDSGYLRDVV